jgi:tRNA pseudouridine38-40 synthase
MAERLAITDAMTAADVHDALARLGGGLMARAMGALERGKLQLTKQSAEGLTYAAKIEKAEARIDWNRPAREVLRHIHALSPFPGAWCEMAIEREQARVKILRCAMADGSGAPGEVLDDHLAVACKEGAIRILELQRAGKQPMKAEDFLRGTPLKTAGAANLMPRYKLTIEYDGAPFCGWQIQDNGASVQGALEDAVKAICGERFASMARAAPMPACTRWRRSRIAISKSHFAPGRLRDGLNAHLRPHPIGVLRRKSCRRFRGAVFREEAPLPLSHHQPRANLALDIGRAGACRATRYRRDAHAAQRLLGKHDFTTFRDTECQAKSPEKTLDQLDVVRDGDAVNIMTSARSFLHSQVRSMVGSLVWVGEGRWSADDLAAALAARDRTACGPVAPPDGLYLVRVEY